MQYNSTAPQTQHLSKTVSTNPEHYNLSWRQDLLQDCYISFSKVDLTYKLATVYI